jgi:ectoine hydroxylase-related dioxygenase (phytanoyl-CoA dioxygenase family)
MPPLYDKNNPYTWQNFDFTPEPGKLIMFKSDVRHSVGKNKSDETRISLAYNFKVI